MASPVNNEIFSLFMGLTLNESLNVVSFYTFNMPDAYNHKPADAIVAVLGRDTLL